MKSAFEKVTMEARTSVALLDRRLPNGIPFEWHHHPEYELTLTLNSKGHRFVGDHMGAYDDGDLVLLGPNVPHTWCSNEVLDSNRPHVAIVSWFSENWATDVIRLMPELAAIKKMLTEARRGIHFSSKAARDVRTLIEDLPKASPDLRLLALLQVLRRLAQDDRRTLLADRYTTPAAIAPDERLQRVLVHLHKHFDEPVNVDDLAAMACLSPSAVHRMFRKHARMTPIAYVMRLRIGNACSILMEKDVSIGAVASRVGYKNLANFNRQFRTLKGMTPREFRALHHRSS